MRNLSDIMFGGAYGSETNQALLIKIKNSGELARSQGSLAALAQALAPATIEAEVYKKMKDDLGSALKAKHVDADISIVEPSAFVPANGTTHVAQDLGVAFLAAGGVFAVGAIMWKLISGGKRK